MKILHGTGVALITPFSKDLSIDYESLDKILQNIKDINYYVVNGTTSESATTSDQEKTNILSFVREKKIKSKPIVYCISSNNTGEILKKIKEIDLTDITAFLITSPFYNKPSQKGIIEHYIAIADHSPLPIILYNVPHRTGSNIDANTTIELSRHSNIIGIKEASGNILQCIEIAKYKDPDFLLISGDDMLTIPIISIGGVGVISVLANVMPFEIYNMVQNALCNKFTESNKFLFDIFEAAQVINEYGNPVGTKILMEKNNLCNKYVRLPLSTPAESS